MRTLFPLIALIAAPLHATGFSPKDLEAAANLPDSAGRDTQTAALVAQTEALRIGLATETKASLAKLSDAERAALTAALGTLDDRRTYQMAWYMAGALTRAGANGASETHLYNPLAQMWITLRWSQQTGGTPQLLGVSAKIARDVPDWTAGAGSYLAAFADSYAVASPRSTATSAPEGLFTEADRWIGGLASWTLIPERKAAILDVSKIIRSGHAAKYGNAGAKIDTLPRLVRASFAPVTGFRRSTGGSVLLGSPLYPNLIIAADFDAAPRPNLQGLTIINLSNATQGAGI
jgi:hypothetical protein